MAERERSIVFVKLNNGEAVYGELRSRDNSSLRLFRPIMVETQQGSDGNLYYVAMRSCHINADDILHYNESSITFTTAALPDYVKDFYHWAALYVYREQKDGVNLEQKDGFDRFANRLRKAVEQNVSMSEVVDDVPEIKRPGNVNPDDLN